MAKAERRNAGNHDITLDEDFYSRHGHEFHNQNIQSSAECLKLFTSSPSIRYLKHASATIRLCSPQGPMTQFTVFGSPYSPRHGHWAFYYDAPVDPSNDAQLTKIWDRIPQHTDLVVTHTPPRTLCDATDEQRASGCEALRRALWRVQPRLAVCGHIHDGRGAARVTWDTVSENGTYAEKPVLAWADPGAENKKLSLVDLTGRKGPLLKPGETCVVNAAMMKSRYPHKGGKEFYKPIVVDVDLPVWTEE
ncbi:hypothetical protein QQS21_010715 [Conoideocrella luteorostrata]|uniref:Calcineurin-like phosphoesterase domain-containing protein n=1 Tax=Conoideocrella luteorostrata TaxID=1105319 RepID=A0AAJ0CFF8_9HYPO|nr:hypothetical protein QQS21_010715 [Conoideocrella luteorostrata]